MKELQSLANVFYVDAIPGIGKTDGAVAMMLKCLTQRKGVFVYAVPTIRLLKEVESRLLMHLDAKAKKRLFSIHNKNRNNDSLTLTKEVVMRLAGNCDYDGERFDALKSGTVFLVTHATFTSLPLHMVNRERVTVIFDEAYRCVFDPTKISLSQKEAQIFRNHIQTIRFDDYELLVRVNLEDSKEELSQLSSRARKKLLEMQGSLSAATSEIYIKVSGAKKQSFELQEVKLPSSMFNGWKKVYLMSAYLKHTQLWALLTRHHFLLNDVPYSMSKYWDEDHQDYAWYPKKRKGKNKPLSSSSVSVSLTDCTSQFIPDYANRLEAFKKRYAKASIVSIMDGPFISRDTLESVLIKNDKDYALKQKKLASVINSITNSDGRVTINGKSLFVNRKLLIRRAQVDPDRLDPKMRKLVDWYKSLNVVAHRPVYEWLLKQSLRLADKWMQKHDAMVLQKEYVKNGKTYKLSMLQKPLVLLNVNEQNEVQHSEMNANIELLPFECAGLNEYKDYQVVIFLAALRAAPSHVAFYNSQIPWYKPSDDYAVASALQAITRGALRKTDSDDKTLIIVSDRAMAEALHSRLMGKPKLFKASDYGTPDVVPFKFMFKSSKKITKSKLKDSKALKEFKTSEKTRLRNIYDTFIKEVRTQSPYYSKMRKEAYLLKKMQDTHGANPPRDIAQSIAASTTKVAKLKQAHKTWAASKKAQIMSSLRMDETKAKAIARQGMEL